MSVAIPKRIAEELEKSDVDVGSLIVDLLVKFLNLDPHVAAESHLELALKYLEEGKRLIDEDPPQASEKLYKAARGGRQGARDVPQLEGGPRRRREERQVERWEVGEGRREDL
jgi:hypothetical protein